LLSSSGFESLVRWDPVAGSTEVLLELSGLFDPVYDFAVGPDGAIYFSDTGARAVWMRTPQGSLRRLISGGQTGFYVAGDGGPLAAATFSGALGLATGSDGSLYLLSSDRIRRVPEASSCGGETPLFRSNGVFNGASYTAVFAPGQIVSLFGAGLGPDAVVTAQLADGVLATELSGVRVLVDDLPAPLVFVSAGQLSAILPYATEPGVWTDQAGIVRFERTAEIVVERDGVRSETRYVYVQDTGPGLFTADASGTGQAAALNEDGTLNNAQNPAAAGSVVVLFGTGEGATNPAGVDGKPAAAPLPQPIADVRVTVNGQPAEVLYAGGAPGLTAGLLQVNVRLPEGVSGTVEIVLEVGGRASRPATLEVLP
jgi:uncharacterized protein (TIGR03437 family)